MNPQNSMEKSRDSLIFFSSKAFHPERQAFRTGQPS
jgi:hypothetical protein